MRTQRNFVEGLKYYVPGMQAGAELGQLLDHRLSFGAPAVANASANDISNAGIVANSGVSTTVTITGKKSDAFYGRSVALKASGATGATVSVSIYGRDYLGQPMVETIAVANADGTNAVFGLKAFRYIDKIVHNGAATNAVTISAGWSTKLGLPYATVAVEREYADGAVASVGTLVAASRTDPQTATSAEPRGTYIPTTTLNGAKNIEIDAQFTNYLNANGRGGLHGIAHFAG
jgi:hypothetical protein